MRYIRFYYKGNIRYGILNGQSVEILNGSSLSEFVRSNIFINVNDIEILQPCTPQKIICTGLNYSDIVLEEGSNIPKEPLLFLKSPSAIIGDNSSIVKNPMVDTLVCEMELGVVIGKQGKNISEEDSHSYIWGYIIANDVTAKDLQKKDIQWTRAKSFDTFLPIGYEIVSGIDTEYLQLTTFINGDIVQSGNTRDMIFNIPYLISYISHIMTLNEGDIILTGTPGGYGKVIDVGDTVMIEIENIGRINNTVINSNDNWCLK